MASTVGRVGALVLSIAALAVRPLAACGGSQPVPAEPASLVGQGDTAQPQAGSNAWPGGAYGFSHCFFEEVGGEVIATLVEGPLGEQVRSNLSYTRLKQLYEQGNAPPGGLKMTRVQPGSLVQQLDTLRAATERYQDSNLAVDDGYVIMGEEVPNMGAHFLHPVRMNDGEFDLAEPEFLLYTREGLDGWELVGAGFIHPTNFEGKAIPRVLPGPSTTGTFIIVCAREEPPALGPRPRKNAGRKAVFGCRHLAG